MFIKEPFKEYLERGKTHMRSHPLILFQESPFKYKAEKDGIMKTDDTSAFSFGRAAHLLILEGEAALWEEYTTIPENLKTVNKNTKEYQTWKKSQEKFILTDQEFNALKMMAKNVFDHESAGGLLSGGVSERTVIADWMGRPCQIRLDHFNNHIVDLKTTKSLDSFEYDARKYKYNNQLAFYRDIYVSASDDADLMEFPPFVYIVAVEKVPPFRAGVWKLKEDWLLMGHTENVRAMKKLDECEDFNYWPHGFEKMRELGFYEGRN